MRIYKMSFTILDINGMTAGVNYFKFYSTSGNYYFGLPKSTISYLGDINKDGVDDFLIGLPYYDFSSTYYSGAAVVYGQYQWSDTDRYVTQLYTAQYGFLFFNNSISNQLMIGYSVSGGSDINNDGIADIIIANPYSDSPQGAYIIYGSDVNFISPFNTPLNGNNGFSFVCPNLTGYSVASIKDFNGDGIGDLIVTCSTNNMYLDGEVYVVYGAKSLPAVLNSVDINGANGISIINSKRSAQFGFKVADVGDINNDGFSDIAISNPFEENGKVYLIYGSSNFPNSFDVGNLNGQNGFVLTTSENNAKLGISLSSAMDFNNDNCADIIVGSASQNYYPKAYIVFGKTDGFTSSLDVDLLNGKNGFVLQFPSSPATISKSVSVTSLKDFNGDGFNDIAVSCGAVSNGVGASYLLLGNASTTYNASIDLSNLNQYNYLNSIEFTYSNKEGIGDSISYVGDINLDGYSDLCLAYTDASGQYTSASNYFACIFGFDISLNSNENHYVIGRILEAGG
jgi:hypothetical protein